MRSLQRIQATNASASVLLIRIVVGIVFLSEGIQKFLFPNDLGVGRFIKIGIPAPQIMAPFVGVCEIFFWRSNPDRSANAAGFHPADY